ncbi:hypothetical protein M9458_041246 [Cirrhinus mrigala]|uniref:Gypsy retrotransposon integrase-like protein 1 n=1 Tax=Cirrhinus mrigala TaxID=683832 RepID=A0ABD0NKE7_CIRMR
MSTENPAAVNPLTELVNALKAAFQPTPAPPSASGSPMAMPAMGDATTDVSFTNHFSEVFSTTTGSLSTSDQLFDLQQGSSSVTAYTLHFRTLAAASGWNETALLGAYKQGLNPDICAAMALYDDSIGLESFLQRTTPPPWLLAPQYQNPCKSIQPGYHAPNVIGVSLMDYAFTVDNRVIFFAPAPSDPHAPLRPPPFCHSSPFITLQIGLFHWEEIRFLVLEDSTVSIILGRPWLQQHRPELSWDPCDIIRWSERCQANCLVNLPHSSPVPIHLSSTRVKSSEPSFTPAIPAEYLAFQDVFSKQAATDLPPHQPWDCAIELLPKGRVYPLSILECQAMEEYIAAALSQGFIQPSTSPATSTFFFVGKKDGGLHPSIDYRQLNSQIKQQPYLLPLVPAALEELCGAQVFTKLDLRSAYNLVRIRAGDEWKTAFVTPTGHYEYRVMPYSLSISPSVFQTSLNKVFREFLHRFVVVYIDDILIYSWNLAEHRQHIQQVLHKLRDHKFHRPSVQFLGYIISAEGVQMDQGKVSAIQEWPQLLTVKELQRFLRFSNFYRHFIKDYRVNLKLSTGTPLLMKHSNGKEIFSTAPTLHHPDPELSFTVEVDASTTGVGAVLSQAVGEPPLLHPCAFYSRKLSSAGQNYDVGNRELLAIKLALEEWRHWLEGSTHPFTIVTDHKNLQYLREARRLNSRQARWALFFTRVNFKITYRPGSKNVSADALSQQFSADHPAEPEPIIPSNLILSPIFWEQDNNIRQATLQKPTPPECPEGKIFVPQSQRLTLLGTAHRSPGSGHPGSQRTLSLLQTRYWWPSMRCDTIRYLQICSVCATSTSPRQLPTGKLVPLPIPQRPWSHIGVDFVTDLPGSKGNTCVLVMVNHFSKMCKFSPLRGLPTATETTELLFQQLFRYFSLPEEIVSDRGPQFISHEKLSSSFLVYHPQTNGQTERKIQELRRYLRAYCHKDQHSWSRFLPWAEYHRPNTLLVHTRNLPMFQLVGLSSSPPPAGCATTQETCSHIPTWGSGLVVDSQPLSTSALPQAESRYIGPFKILRQISDVTFQLQLPPRNPNPDLGVVYGRREPPLEEGPPPSATPPVAPPTRSSSPEF